MENFLPTYSEFSKFNDGYRLKHRKKPRNPEWLKKAYYPLALIGMLIGGVFLIFIQNSLRKTHRKPSYKTSPNYRKVIKEGVLWDSVEYHQR